MEETMNRSIIVPVDLAECTGDVVAEATRLARESSYSVVLLHALPQPEGVPAGTRLRDQDGGGQITAGQLLERGAREQLTIHARNLRQQGLQVTTLVAPGDPVRLILDAAREHQAAYIVMGTHGRKGLSRLVLGSVAERVMRLAEQPVITVRTRWRPECKARSCAWCASHVTPAQQQVLAETEG
jgi:universal stress protein A